MRKFVVALAAAGALAVGANPVADDTASYAVASPAPVTSPGSPSPVPSAVSAPRGQSPSQQVPIDSDPNALKPGWILLIVVAVPVLLFYAAEIAFLRSRRKNKK